MGTTRRDLAEKAWGSLLRAHANVVPVLDAELRAQHRLPVHSYDVLLVLRRSPEGRLTMTDLSSCVMLSRSRVSRVVDEMVDAGLVVREDNPDDRRSSFVVLTPAGRSLQRAAGPTLLRLLEDRVASPFSDDELEQFAGLLERLAAPPPGDVNSATERRRG
ncbi:MAG: MarR family transcriptional regulator [Solirubrobacteraceae bacterium]|nr:MarR family transcriptional regulator [Solirubrobacteraceae bacterium]